MDNEKQTYQWIGINSQGQRQEGVIVASNPKDSQSELKKQGIEVISVKLKTKMKLSLFNRKKKIKKNDILLFTRYLSTMISAGLSIIQALDIISKDQENPSMQTLVLSLKSSISGGKTLSESFGQHPKYFGDLYCNLIRAGEKSGTLDKILARLGNYLERTENLKRKVKKALVYPAAIVSVALVVSLILLIFVVPQFEKMFSSFGAQLPFFTQIIVSISAFLRTYWWLLILFIVALVWGGRRSLRQSEDLQELRDRWILKMPVIGPIIRKSIIARYTRTLSTTLEAGLPIVDSMKTLAQIMGNRIYTRAVLEICDDVTSGHTLSTSMNSTQLFPNMAVQMIAVGEASGTLADMLNKVADYYEGEVSNIVDNLSSLLEPLIMAVLGVIIGSFVVAMYLPIFKIGSLF